MFYEHHLLLAAFSAGLVLGGAPAAQAATATASAGVVAGEFSQRTDVSNPGQNTETRYESPETRSQSPETQFRSGYSEGYSMGANDAASCTLQRRVINGNANYLRGVAAGYTTRFSAACPHARQPSITYR